VKITRIYDDNGQSRFTDIDISLTPLELTLGVSGFRMSAPFAGGECSFLFMPQCVMEQHAAPRRQLFIILSGEAEIMTGDGNTRRFRRGDVFLADDTTGEGHISRCLTDVTVLFVPLADIPA
jgi:hypothetical protein